jgi:tetratricopeptide (TPR) repeat protein
MRAALLRAICLAVLLPVAARAQRALPTEPLLRGTPPVAARATCGPLAPAAASDTAHQRQARELAQRGQQSAILGDRVAARDLLRRAAALDPANADLAYQLARAEESAGSEAEAAKAYCRFIALAPDAPDAAESRARLAQLMLADRQADSLRAASAFARAATAYERGQLDSAEVAFTAALTLAPDWAEAYYDRGVVRSALGRRADAAGDFQQYLRLEPGAANRAELASRVSELQQEPLSPTRALAFGLVIPGGGQFYAGRPVRGALSLLGAGIALACSMSQHASTELVQQTAIDPFGNPYTYSTSRRVIERPCRTPGLTAAGVIALLSAVDAYRFARH